MNLTLNPDLRLFAARRIAFFLIPTPLFVTVVGITQFKLLYRSTVNVS